MKKFITIAAAAAFLFTGTLSASAQTDQNLQAQIDALLAQIAMLNGGTTVAASGTSMLSDHNGVNLRRGSRGARVMELQRCMNAAGYNTGVVDGIYGANTASGVMLFQASRGLVVDGIVGVRTTPAFQAACMTGTTTPVTPVTPVTPTELTLGGEGDISDYDFKSEDDADANSSEEHIATIEFEVEDGDVQLEKVDLYFEEQTVANDLWENIENIKLVVDGEEIADVDVSDDNDWDEHDDDLNAGMDLYSITLTGDVVFEEGDKVEIEVLIDTTDEVESTDADEDYMLWAELRFVNGEGISLYEGEDEDSDLDAIAFSIEAADAFDLTMTENNDSPEDDESLDLSSDINGEVLVIVDVEIEDNQDGTLEEAEVDVLVTLATGMAATDVDELINELSFFVDGDKVDSDDVDTSVTDAGVLVTYTFDLDDMEVDAEDEFEISIEGDFNDIEDDSEFVGATLTVAEIRIDGEDAAGDSFAATFDEATSYAPVFTATAGTIDVNWTEEPVVYSDGDDTTNDGDYIAFAINIENNTGSDLTGMELIANWDFDFDGYAVAAADTFISEDDAIFGGDDALAVVPTAAILMDGDDAEYFFIAFYTATSTQDFTIELEEVAVENVPVAETWEE